MTFRDADLVSNVVAALDEAVEPGFPYRLMHVCGSHEHTISRWGLRSLLPEGLEVIAGPGCPVCVCPPHEVGEAIELARRGAIVATFGDMLNLPTNFGSLAEANATGGDVRVVYSPLDAVALAARNPGREVVLFAVGFETTAAPVATALGSANLPDNFSVLVSHRSTPPAMELLLGIGDICVDGFIAPGHVSAITGAEAWQRFPDAYAMPVVVAGFEPEDVLLAMLLLVEQINRGEATLENEYSRVVPKLMSSPAVAAIDAVFEVSSAWWRGIGRIPRSGLALRRELGSRDARERFDVHFEAEQNDLPPGCSCHLVMLGKVHPPACALYGRKCTPSSPHGPCMVSQEGTCFIWYTYESEELPATTQGDAS